MDQKYLVSVENGAGSLSNTEIGKKTLDMRISSEYSYNPGMNVWKQESVQFKENGSLMLVNLKMH